MPMDHDYSLRCTEECRPGTTGWQSPPDPTDSKMVDKGQVVVLAQALGLMFGHGKTMYVHAVKLNKESAGKIIVSLCFL